MHSIHVTAVLTLSAALAATAPITTLAAGLEITHAFDADAQELPEGLSLDPAGNAYVTMGHPFWFAPGDGWIKKLGTDGTLTTLAHFEAGQAPAGIVADADGSAYFAWPNPGNPDTNGVYRLDQAGTWTRLPGSESIVLANGLALDRQGNLLVSDSALGTVWRIALDGSGVVEPWFADPALLGGCADGDVGANGLALWEDSVYVANTGRGLLVRIATGEDGSAGKAVIVAGDDTNACDPDGLWGMDGIALDVEGNVYALLVLQNQLVRIDPSDGSHEVLLTEADGLHNPASLAFGTIEGDRQSLYLVNYALLPPAPEGSPGPALLRYHADVEGLPLP